MYQKTVNIKNRSIFSRTGLAAVITVGVMASPLWVVSVALADDTNREYQDGSASTSMDHGTMSRSGGNMSMDHKDMSMNGKGMATDHHDMSAGSREMHELMTKGMQDMPMTGDTDQDFAMMMIKHHQDGIDMARIQMKYGKDDKARHMAEESIAAQQKDIHQLEDWQQTHR